MKRNIDFLIALTVEKRNRLREIPERRGRVTSLAEKVISVLERSGLDDFTVAATVWDGVVEAAPDEVGFGEGMLIMRAPRRKGSWDFVWTMTGKERTESGEEHDRVEITLPLPDDYADLEMLIDIEGILSWLLSEDPAGRTP